MTALLSFSVTVPPHVLEAYFFRGLPLTLPLAERREKVPWEALACCGAHSVADGRSGLQKMPSHGNGCVVLGKSRYGYQD